ncbi:hypothetical protein [uncultured Campylobacter sp.]|nr:hypothetical protein [uncultured Campylobacter sp.]
MPSVRAAQNFKILLKFLSLLVRLKFQVRAVYKFQTLAVCKTQTAL